MLNTCIRVVSVTEGTVRDKDSGEPISSAVVTVNKNMATTDGFGHYRLVGYFMPGDTMIINAPSYNIHTLSIKSMHSVVDIDLKRK
ncbi:carboxypeptidase regulatory-like domain-containing protein [Phocoenobacter skyensis]|uniref:Carboxypeptidase regulatory-like domain-containing protein n=1 Tax=Phocoenobacter skyensis TaxID=97481 RepID=A0ABT9JMV1_9PAST|nr:carboxypeptidase regulatory-like domain-containing protein [Pasteurella skyensis]MDP8080175.1 hypothetical protein [Pasteurella skyensis]MDP8086133.1 hypothetical protein [Pasteurella skyensis]MDP8185893.1 hypothetical protein [Pasteurella skyensis]